MKTHYPLWRGTAALAMFLAVPPAAFAQVRGSFIRPGAQVAPTVSSGPVIQAVPTNSSNLPTQQVVRPVPAPAFTPMRSGVIERGSQPTYPNYNYSNNYGNNNYGNNVPVLRQGPVVVLPDAPTQYHRPSYSTSTFSSNNHRQDYSGQNNSRSNYPPPVGPANGFFNNSTPPVGPANGFGENTTPPRRHRPEWGNGNHYVYGLPPTSYPVIVNAPPLLGGYYYGGYCDNYASTDSCPSVYSVYSGFPQYIYGPGVIVVGQPYVPVYATSYLPFCAPTYQTVYNENTYYVGSQSRVDALDAGGNQAQQALKNAYPANSFQAAFADIARAWTDGDITLLRRHLRDKDTRISVSLNKKYSYSIASGDFSEITRDALGRLQTVSFEFTRLRKAKNGDVTAFGTHIYRVADGTTSNSESNSDSGDGGTVPFDQSGTDSQPNVSPYDQSNDLSSGDEKTVYVSYTLRRHAGEWYITAIDSSDHPLVTAQ